MSTKLEAGAWLIKLAYTAAGATILGGGTMVLKNAQDNAVQTVLIDQNTLGDTKRDVTLEKLDEAVRKLDKNVAILTEQLKKE
jgi:hypothetical protein